MTTDHDCTLLLLTGGLGVLSPSKVALSFHTVLSNTERAFQSYFVPRNMSTRHVTAACDRVPVVGS